MNGAQEVLRPRAAALRMTRIVDVPAWFVAALLAVAYLIIDPPSADLAAQVYRSNFFAHHGFALWDDSWYGGHHMPGYSVLFPPLGALLGPRLVGALSAIASAFLFQRVAREHFGGWVRAGTLWFGAATAINLITGRLAFGLGVTFGVAAILAATHRRRGLAALLAVGTTLASPVAGVFLALGAAAWWLTSRRGPALELGAGALLPAVALMAAFPEGGVEPFVASAFWEAMFLIGAVLVALPREERELRAGVLLYAAATVASYTIDTPMGGNVTRLGALFGGPVLACLLWRHSRKVLAVVAIPLIWWQWSAPVHDWLRANDDPSIDAAYYQPLLGFLDRQADRPFRIEIPFTANHWEAARVAPHYALARGWERQLDLKDNHIFYSAGLTASRYRRWLHVNAVRFVAVPDVRLDKSALAEARLVDAGLPYLRPVWRGAHWRVYEVAGASPLARGPGRVTLLGPDHFSLRASRAGRIDVRVRFTPYWKLVRGAGCVARTRGDWTQLRLRRPGDVEVAARFAPGRVFSRGPRCTSG